MTPIYVLKSSAEAPVITSLMEAYGVRHHIQGGAMGALYPGVPSLALNTQTLMVDPTQAALARELMAGFEDDAPA